MVRGSSTAFPETSSLAQSVSESTHSWRPRLLLRGDQLDINGGKLDETAATLDSIGTTTGVATSKAWSECVPPGWSCILARSSCQLNAAYLLDVRTGIAQAWCQEPKWATGGVWY